MISRPKHDERRKPPSFPAGCLGFAVGDLHGRLDLLERMTARILRQLEGATYERAIGVFLGDYVDRGPDSAGVLAYLTARLPPGVEWRFLMGNHEDAMVRFIDAPLANRGWLAHGGLETLASYKIKPLPSIGSSEDVIERAHEQLKSLLPPSHAAFLRSLERHVLLGDYLFVHAGIDVGVALEKQKDADLYWGRHKFLSDKRSYEHMVVHGHTPERAPFQDHRRICLDIGAYATGRLCAAQFEGESVAFLIEEIPPPGAQAC